MGEGRRSSSCVPCPSCDATVSQEAPLLHDLLWLPLSMFPVGCSGGEEASDCPEELPGSSRLLSNPGNILLSPHWVCWEVIVCSTRKHEEFEGKPQEEEEGGVLAQQQSTNSCFCLLSSGVFCCNLLCLLLAAHSWGSSLAFAFFNCILATKTHGCLLVAKVKVVLGWEEQRRAPGP